MSRLLLLDVFRGLAVVLMVIVDAPPDFNVIYPILKHSEWAGLTIADLAFPFFVFAMGMSAALSKNFNLRKIITRVALLFVIGLIFNIYPQLLSHFMLDADLSGDIRILGVLQRLALTYLLGVISCHMLKSNKNITAAAFILLLLSSLNAHLYLPINTFNMNENINRALDMAIIGQAHMYQQNNFVFDLENLYGTINSVATMLFGFIACRVMTNREFTDDETHALTLFGVVLLIVGGLWSYFDIISKPLWTAPYVLITSGLAYLLLAIFNWSLEKFRTARKILQPLAAFGMNPLFFYIATNFALIFLRIYQFEGVPLYLYIWQNSIQGVISPAFSAMLFTFLWCLLWLPLAEFLCKRNIIIKI